MNMVMVSYSTLSVGEACDAEFDYCLHMDELCILSGSIKKVK